MTTTTVLTSTDHGVLTIRLNRPEQMNSLDAELKAALLSALDAAAGDASVRCVVLIGTGRAFCSGQDVAEMLTMAGTADVEQSIADFYAPVVRTIVGMPKPVLAAINGAAVGAGLSIALACDLRIATASARFGTAFATIGLSCDTGLSWTLPRIIGRGAALDLLLRPRLIDAAEALRLGLVSEVATDGDFAARVVAVAAAIAAGPTLAFASMKASIHYAETSTLDEALAFETTRMGVTGESQDHGIAVAAFLAKQPPQFVGS